MDAKGFGDRYQEMQQKSAPKIDKNLVGERIEVLYKYFEDDGSVVNVWCKCTVEGLYVKKTNNTKSKRKANAKVTSNNEVIIRWDAAYLRYGDVNPTRQKLLVSKWNKHDEKSWRFILNEN